MSAKILQFPKPEAPDHDPLLTKARAAVRKLQAQADRRVVAQALKNCGIDWPESAIDHLAAELRNAHDSLQKREG